MVLSRFRSGHGRGVRGVTTGVLTLSVMAGFSLLTATPALAVTRHNIAIWHMEETSGPMVDSADSHNGTVTNVTRGVTGSAGNAYKFNGTSSEVVVPSSTAFNVPSAIFEISLQVKFSNTPQQLGADSFDLIRKGLSGGQYWKVEISSTGKTTCHFTGSSGVADISGAGPILADGLWHHIDCRKESGDLHLNVDAVRVGSKTVTIGTVTNINVLTLGFKRDPNIADSDFFKGRMDEVQITTFT